MEWRGDGPRRADLKQTVRRSPLYLKSLDVQVKERVEQGGHVKQFRSEDGSEGESGTTSGGGGD